MHTLFLFSIYHYRMLANEIRGVTTEGMCGIYMYTKLFRDVVVFLEVQ